MVEYLLSVGEYGDEVLVQAIGVANGYGAADMVPLLESYRVREPVKKSSWISKFLRKVF